MFTIQRHFCVFSFHTSCHCMRKYWVAYNEVFKTMLSNQLTFTDSLFSSPDNEQVSWSLRPGRLLLNSFAYNWPIFFSSSTAPVHNSGVEIVFSALTSVPELAFSFQHFLVIARDTACVMTLRHIYHFSVVEIHGSYFIRIACTLHAKIHLHSFTERLVFLPVSRIGNVKMQRVLFRFTYKTVSTTKPLYLHYYA